MIREIVKLAFEKAKLETPNVSKTGLSRHISRKIEESDSRKIFSYKTFTRYYDKYILEKNGVIDYPQTEIIEELCKYLDYANYQDFVIENKVKVKAHQLVKRKSRVLKKEKIILNKSKNLNLKTASLQPGGSGKNVFVKAAVSIVMIFFLNISWQNKDCMHEGQKYRIRTKTEDAVNQNIRLEFTKHIVSDTSLHFNHADHFCYNVKRYQMASLYR